MSVLLVLAGLSLCAVSGLPGLLLNRTRSVGQWLANAILVGGCVVGLAGVIHWWRAGDALPVVLPWPVPGGEFRVQLDGLSALFLVPVFVVASLGSIYGLGYWAQSRHAENGGKLRIFYGLLAAGMALLLIARNSLLFLAGWEVMALSAFFLVTTEDDDPDVRRAGWIYLVATHVSVLCLFALFALLGSVTGSLLLRPLSAGEISPQASLAVFVLCLTGFGIKAGLMPFHVWLPGAHAMAPSHVSAMMSGVMLKMGIYGIVRVTSLLPDPPLAWGGALLALGAASGILGVAFAIGQHDLKRLLAYHSIENIGIIVMGLGLAMLGRSSGCAAWVALGLGGALLHVWNHAFFKALLFFSAGSVIHATGTREIDRLGGLAKAMPRTAACFLVGAVAICGLPPLNGFVSEFLIYLGLFRTLGIDGGPEFVGAAFAAPALALIGGLAVACFVKVFGAVFLGSARSQYAEGVHDCGGALFAPMLVLAVCCFAIGLGPLLVAPLLDRAVAAWAVELPASALQIRLYAPLGWISAMGAALLAGVSVGGVILIRLRRRNPLAAGPTWGCGYAVPTPRMQYTSSSFAQLLVGLFAWALRPRERQPQRLQLFPQPAAFHSEVRDPVLDELVLPGFRAGARLLGRLRVFQQGSIQLYLLYIFLTLCALLLWRSS